ncbi:hypothetical protein SHKM778_88470 [Streptomyces sp. KM77-8]|uniref:GNAT family N-acetyltransferase n=1 Tax=Streptomyces haneummycinicus TaxID=3074435 RepID=A0AAT9HZS0_9ACTN
MLVGSAAPAGEAAGATVAARVLPEHRGQGHGTALHAAGTAHARGLCAAETETGVPAADTEGPRLAAAAGFTERERYVPDGRREERADLRLRAG